MAAGDDERDSAGERLNRARGGAGQVRGKARELGARRIRAGRQGDGRRDELCSRRLGVREEGEGDGREEKFPVLAKDKGDARRARFARMLDAWRARRRPGTGMGIGRAQ